MRIYIYREREGVGRFSSLDSLRGLLAFFVFIHHAVIWYEFLQIGQWEMPNSSLYEHLGKSSVRFFFMITSFLFIGKLISGKEIDWLKMLKSRIFRIAPLYYLVVAIVILIVFIKTDFTIQKPLRELLVSIRHWLTFTTKGAVSINGYQDTRRIVSGVVWTLPYEWFFYFTLPIWYLLLVRKKIKISVLFISLIVSGILFYLLFDKTQFYHFLGGIMAVYAFRFFKKMNADSWVLSIVVILSTIGIVMTKSLLFLILFGTIVFSLIAMGNTIFGLLKLKVLKILGEMSYSIYLLHGIILFVTIDMILGRDFVKTFSPLQFWLLIFGIIPILVAVSAFSYKYIEKPFIDFKIIKIRS